MSDIVSSLDQPLIRGLSKDPEWQILNDRIDATLEVCVEVNSLMPALAMANELRKSAGMKALAFSRIIYEGAVRAKDFGLTRGAYIDLVFVEVGLSSSTVGWHIDIWEELFSRFSVVPKRIRPRLLERPQRSHKEIVRAVRHRKVTPAEWTEIIQAPDHGEIVKITRRIREMEPPTGGMVIFLDREGGLTAWEEGYDPEPVGMLRASEADLESDLRKRAINYILEKCSRIKRR
jgi:hypothetical protein